MNYLKNLGKPLTSNELKFIQGGRLADLKKKACSVNSDCGSGVCAHFEKPTGDYPAGNYCL